MVEKPQRREPLLNDLTPAKIKEAIASERDQTLHDGGSLSLKIRGGSALWIYKYRDGASFRSMSLGSYHDGVGLTVARDKRDALAVTRRDQRKAVKEAIQAAKDATAAAKLVAAKARAIEIKAPNSEDAKIAADKATEAAAEATTAVAKASAVAVRKKRMKFADLVDSFITLKASEWKVNSREPDHYRRLKTGALGRMWADEITHAAVERELNSRWGDALANADKMRVRISLVINHAVAKGAREDGPNPARKEIIKHLVAAAPASTPRPALAHQDVPALMAKLIADNSPAARSLALCILTVTRNKEARLADWREVVKKDWIIPGGREERSMKEQQEHAVPLSDAAIGLLGKRKDGLIFGQLPTHALNDKLAAMVGAGPTVHGFRTAFTSWARAAKYPRELRELAKAHAEGQNAYERYTREEQLDLLRPMLQAWSDYVMRLVKD